VDLGEQREQRGDEVVEQIGGEVRGHQPGEGA
jgi:hypothetical protein